MNYTRRTTRPDGMHYRETRKHVRASRGRRAKGGGVVTVALLVAAVLVALLVFWVFRG
jgi:hypothetical protein